MESTIISKYIIVPETKSIRAEFNENGDCRSMVIEGNYTFTVDMKPVEIIEASLNYYGFDLNGAISGSKTVIGLCHAAPIRIPGMIDMYWFPHTLPHHDECVWFALHQVEAILPEGEDLSRIYLKGGPCFKLNSTAKALSEKYDRTEKYETKISKRTENTLSFIMERTTDIYSVEKGKRNYVITRKKE